MLFYRLIFVHFLHLIVISIILYGMTPGCDLAGSVYMLYGRTIIGMLHTANSQLAFTYFLRLLRTRSLVLCDSVTG